MSGISGSWRFARNNPDVYAPARVETLAQTLAHRGNTPAASYQDESVLLISNYFAVAPSDTATGIFEDKAAGYVCALAGRIYNVEPLRQTLAAQGFACRTQTQEEAVLRAFLLWGIDFAVHLDGQFGGVLWDQKEHRLLLFRDRLGQRDVFYTIAEQGVVFGSELKAVLAFLDKRPQLNPSALANVLMNQFIYEPFSAYQDIYKLEKGTVRWIRESGETDATLYWDILKEYRLGIGSPISFEQAKKELRTSIFDAVESQILPGEEIGSFLSGGLDSSIVSGVLAKVSPRKIHTFSIGFRRDNWDESAKFNLEADYLGTQHHCISMGYQDVEADWERILFNYDEPYADAAAYGEYCCAKMAGQYVRCAFGGEGGDELFAGFQLQADLSQSMANFRLPKNRCMSGDSYTKLFLPEVYQMGLNKNLRALLQVPSLHNHAQAAYARCLYRAGGSISQRAGLAYLAVYHLVELIKIDRACQQAGLETRRPLQSSKVVELSFHLKTDDCIRFNERRYLYKQAFRDLLPDQIYHQTKMGFGLPVVEWLYQYRRAEVERLFHRDLIEEQGIFHYKALEPTLKAFYAGTNDYSFWYYYTVQKWYNDFYLKL